MNTKFNYLYRDADNYKRAQDVVLKGEITPKQESIILEALDGDYFIPRQVGLPENRLGEYDPDADHCYFEFLSFELTDRTNTEGIDVQELANRFSKVKDWDDFSYLDENY